MDDLAFCSFRYEPLGLDLPYCQTLLFMIHLKFELNKVSFISGLYGHEKYVTFYACSGKGKKHLDTMYDNES